MSDKPQPSTAQAIYDNVTGTIQSTVSNLMGNTDGQVEGKAKQDKAQLENDASHATLKLPGVSASSSGAVTKDHPDRAAGSWNQTAGSAKEAIGGLVGAEGLKQSGREQNLQGREQEARGQLSDYASGVADRATGAVGGVVSNLTGNPAQEAEYQKQHDTGKTQQRGAEHDIAKQAQAEAETK